MRRPQLLASVFAVVGLSAAPALSPAFAQPAPSASDGVAATLPGPQPNTSPGDPPARVGRLAWTRGAVSFHTGNQDHWEPATRNYPVVSTDAFWTETGASAQMDVAAHRLVLNERTELDVSALNEQGLVLTLPQGEVYLRLRDLRPTETFKVATPRAVVTLSGNGRYGIVAGDTEHPTTVSVIEGTATLTGDNVNVQVAAGQMASIIGTNQLQASIVSLAMGQFLKSQIAAERPVVAVPAGVPAYVQRLPGYADLSENGTWDTTTRYGQVWYPPVDRAWVPYRDGHWAFVAPWGWTWIDDAPWGFAPFHYGRWVEIDARWAWLPGEPPRAEPVVAGPVFVAPEPVYAPALVSFVDPGLALGAAVAVGTFTRPIGWCPLGPGEPYIPPYRSSPEYIKQINITNVRNVSTISNTTVINHFSNASAVTVVPAAALASSARVAPVARSVPVAALAGARPLVGPVPVVPTRQTLGVTPAVAERLQLPAALPAAAAAEAHVPSPAPPVQSPGPALTRQSAAVPMQALRRPDLPGTATAGQTTAAPALRVPAGRPSAPAPAPTEPGASQTARGLQTSVPPLLRPEQRGQTPPAVLRQPDGTERAHASTPVSAPPVAPGEHAAPLSVPRPSASAQRPAFEGSQVAGLDRPRLPDTASAAPPKAAQTMGAGVQQHAPAMQDDLRATQRTAPEAPQHTPDVLIAARREAARQAGERRAAADAQQRAEAARQARQQYAQSENQRRAAMAQHIREQRAAMDAQRRSQIAQQQAAAARAQQAAAQHAAARARDLRHGASARG